MRKRGFFVVIAVSALASGCINGPVVGNDAINKSYQQEMEQYKKAKDEVRPSPSLWVTNGVTSSLFLDYKNRSVGEIVTINIMEASLSSNSSSTDTTKKQTSSSSAATIFGIPLDKFGTDIKSSHTFKGSANRNKKDTVTGTMSARVIEVLPSGNVVLEGHKEIVVENQTQTITLSGIARPRDIAVDNTIDSTLLADAKIDCNGKGQLSLANVPTWLMSLLGWISPL